jgi:hypothetical protein
MNWSAMAAIVASLTLLTVLLGGGFIYGRLTQEVKGNSATIEDHHLQLEKHEARISQHAVDLGRLHEWKDGFNAGSRSATVVRE